MTEIITSQTSSNKRFYSAIKDSKKNYISYSKEGIDSKFNYINIMIFTVVLILIVMVATLIIDSFHFNSVIYKEYSDKTETMDNLRKINQTLIEQNNQKDKTIINLIEIKKSK